MEGHGRDQDEACERGTSGMVRQDRRSYLRRGRLGVQRGTTAQKYTRMDDIVLWDGNRIACCGVSDNGDLSDTVGVSLVSLNKE